MSLTDLGLLFMRFGFALSMALRHGLDKLLNFSQSMNNFPDPLHITPLFSLSLTVFAEFFCAIAIAIGLFTRLSCVPLIICMSVAFFIIHGGDPFSKKEMAFLYLISFICIFISGPGKYSVDGLFRGVS